MLDLRMPIGMMFLIIGALLVGQGFFCPVSTPLGVASINLDLIWGLVMGLFGLIMVALSSKPGASP